MTSKPMLTTEARFSSVCICKLYFRIYQTTDLLNEYKIMEGQKEVKRVMNLLFFRKFLILNIKLQRE